MLDIHDVRGVIVPPNQELPKTNEFRKMVVQLNKALPMNEKVFFRGRSEEDLIYEVIDRIITLVKFQRERELHPCVVKFYNKYIKRRHNSETKKVYKNQEAYQKHKQNKQRKQAQRELEQHREQWEQEQAKQAKDRRDNPDAGDTDGQSREYVPPRRERIYVYGYKDGNPSAKQNAIAEEYLFGDLDDTDE